MITQVRKDSKKKRIRPNKSHTVKDREDIYEGEGYIFRTEAGGKFWSVSFWIPEEKKEYRRSLKTKNKIEALIRAKNEFHFIKSKVQGGIRVWDITVSELIEEYLKHQEKESENGKKTKGRVGTIRSQLKHFSEFVGPKTRLNDIKDNQFEDYVSFRKKKESKVQNVTLLNEKSTFRTLLNYSQRKGYLSRDRDWNFGTIKKVIVRRDMIELKDYKKMYQYMRVWGKNEENERLKDQKEFIRHFILILSNTGIRFGEGRRLQWKDVQVINDKKGPKLIRVNLEYHKTKTGKDRLVIGRNGEVLERLKKHSKWTGKEDYLFVDNETGKPIDKKVYYRLWEEIVQKTNLKDLGYTYYGLRHSYATWRLASGVNVFDLSKVMGCSVKFIEEHYGHVNVDKMSKYLTKDMLLDDNDEIIWGG